jgi:hypothetical protein
MEEPNLNELTQDLKNSPEIPVKRGRGRPKGSKGKPKGLSTCLTKEILIQRGVSREGLNLFSPAQLSRKIDSTTISQIAELVAKMLTESEACRLLGIEPRKWFTFKTTGANSNKWEGVLEAFRAKRFDSMLTRIEQSANGENGVKYPDWRAAAHIAKIMDRNRFGDQVEVHGTQTHTIDTRVMDGLKRAYFKNCKLEKPIDVKQIEAPADDGNG